MFFLVSGMQNIKGKIMAAAFNQTIFLLYATHSKGPFVTSQLRVPSSLTSWPPEEVAAHCEGGWLLH
jgi:hypothetical protein